jgi:cystathionine beta-lyase/cystathionine gamma-synthase
MMDAERDLSFILNELGEDRSHYFNAIAPPIIQTSNFRVNTVDELEKLLADEYSGFLYSRGLNPTVEILKKKLAALDEAEDCLVFSSGAAASFAAVLANVNQGDHIISVKNPYSSVKRMFDLIFSRFGVETTYIDGTDMEQFEQARQANSRFIYLESPNSWNFAIQNIEETVAFAKRYQLITLLDNSYCTPLFQKPIPMGIDICMQTATKYIGGHSDTLGGILTGSRQMMKKIFDCEYLCAGSGIQPFNAWLLIRGLRTIETRLERITATTREVLHYLKRHPLVESVLFPLDESFPQYELARKQMKNAGGLISFFVKTDARQEIVRFCENLKHIVIAVSWGGHESLILPRCAGLDGDDFDASIAEHRMLRIYIGLESAEYLIGDLDQSFRLSF